LQPLPPNDRSLGEPLSIDQVAELLGCSPWTVRNALIPRGIPHFRFSASGRLTFFEDQVIRWIENQQEGGQTTK
jgi:excisionase family DNA binding protein